MPSPGLHLQACAGNGKFYAAMENLQIASAACDVDYIHGRFLGCVSAMF
jgi:hypothetical protein